MSDATDQARRPPVGSGNAQGELLKLISSLAYRHSQWQVFVDFAEMAAISVGNAVDIVRREKREERYMEVIKRYKPDELAKFPQMFAALTLALEEEPGDILGKTFHDLELHNKWAGQYFSPYHLCRMMAKVTVGNSTDLATKVSERGFVTAMEPACGSGAMVIALAHEMRDAKIDYQQHLHVTAVDVDIKCVHMAYLQFALLHIPAVIIHGNSLSLEEFGRWYTPAHIMGGWDWRLKRQAQAGETHEILKPPEPSAPVRPREDDPPERPAQLTLF